MKVIILPVSHFYPFYQNSASERFWCDWLLQPLQADKYDGTQNLGSYDLIIYQKAHNEVAVRFSEQGKHKYLKSKVDLLCKKYKNNSDMEIQQLIQVQRQK